MSPLGYSPCLLPQTPAIEHGLRARLEADYRDAGAGDRAEPLDVRVCDQYDIDLSTTYAGLTLRNPWGKASGQLSMTARQVEEDVAAGLGFVVLKTVIAQDEQGAQSMGAWAIREARMETEPIVGASGELGWTVSWKGRGWWQPFEEYLELVRASRRIAAGTGVLIVPSCKYHLPASEDEPVRTSEYRFTTQSLLAAWQRPEDPPGVRMPLEKDFSPTLAGSDRAAARDQILRWIEGVPKWLADAAQAASAASLPGLRPGLKLFNALFDDEFQLEMLRAVHRESAPRFEYLVYANRLFDPHREFDGKQGIAFGGPDLSDRNLRVMDRFLGSCSRDRNGMAPGSLLEWSATGNIGSGRMAVEYALRGATSFQLHTFFQLPASEYRATAGTRSHKALHELYFHPQNGLIAWLAHVAGRLGLCRKPLRFREIVGRRADLLAAGP